MAVITIHGPLGAGAVSIGQMVAQSLEINFYDRLIFNTGSQAYWYSRGGGNRQGTAG